MTDLVPMSAFGARAPRELRSGPLTLREVTDLGLASMAVPRGAPAPAPFGLTLPGPGLWAASERAQAVWTGPGQWMLALPGQGEADILPGLMAEAPGAALTEQTDGWVVIDAAGEAAAIEALLMRLVNVDVARLAPGAALRTGLHHMSVIVIRLAPDALCVMGMRTAAGSLWHAIDLAAGRLPG